MVMRLTTKLKEYKQEKALPYLRTKFFATFFTALITVAINISRDGDGPLYTIYKWLCTTYFGNDTDGSIFISALKNLASIFARSIDVALDVIVIFYVIYFIISFIQNRIYSKSSKKHRQYLKELLWNDIIPNILEINKIEVEFLSKKDSLTNFNISHWRMILLASLNSHKDIMYMIYSEGIFETISSNNNVSKHYIDYLKNINILLIRQIFNEQLNTLKYICNSVENDALYNDYLYDEYNKILKEYNDVVNMINANVRYCINNK